MHYKFMFGILCWPVVMMGQSGLSPSIRLFPVRSGTVTFYPHPPQSADTLVWAPGVVRDHPEVDPGCAESTLCEKDDLVPLRLTLQQSVQRLYRVSPALQMAKQLVGMARAERTRLRSFWYPFLGFSGAYVHLSQPIEVRQSLKPYTESVKDWLSSFLPAGGRKGTGMPALPLGSSAVAFPSIRGVAPSAEACLPPGWGTALEGALSAGLAPQFTSFLDQLGTQTFTFPLLSSSLTGTQLQCFWPIFTGGKRYYASRIGHRLVDGAEIHRSSAEAAVQTRMIEAYFKLRLAIRVTAVRKQALEGMERHLFQAQRMEQEGMINKAEGLFARVARDEARREWQSAVHQQQVALHTLQVMLELDDHTSVVPVSPLFLNVDLPPVSYFKERVGEANYQVRQLSVQESMANDRVKMGRAAYWPTVALMGSQQLYTRHLPAHLLPRTMVGVGFSWNLFDGFRREGKVRRACCLRNTLRDGRTRVLEDLEESVDRLYAWMQHAQDDVSALHSTIRLSRELLRIRRKSFEEGMATSSDVVDAETLLAKVQVAYLVAYYEYDVSLSALLALCGIPEAFWSYASRGEKEDFVFQ